MSTKFGKFLEKFMKDNNYTLEYISLKTESSLSIVGHYRKGIRIPKDEFIERFIANFNFDKVEANYIRYIVAFDRTPDLIKEKIEKIEKRSHGKIQKLPIKGKAAAGLGYMNFQENEKFFNINLPTEKKLPKEVFLVEVDGNSMFPTLLDGDMILIDPNLQDKEQINGKIAVFTYFDQTYVKRVKISENQIRLISDNSDKKTYPDIVIEGENLEFLSCQGVVIESRRTH